MVFRFGSFYESMTFTYNLTLNYLYLLIIGNLISLLPFSFGNFLFPSYNDKIMLKIFRMNCGLIIFTGLR